MISRAGLIFIVVALQGQACNAFAQKAFTDQDQVEMTAVARIFTERFNLGQFPGRMPPFAIVAPGFSKGEGRMAALTLYREPDEPCTYKLSQSISNASVDIAQIKFDLLSDEYKTDGRWFGFLGTGDAVCKNSRFLKGMVEQEKGWVCQSNYSYSFNPDDDHRDQVVRAFAYIFSNLCTPHRMPVQ